MKTSETSSRLGTSTILWMINKYYTNIFTVTPLLSSCCFPFAEVYSDHLNQYPHSSPGFPLADVYSNHFEDY